MRYKEEYSAYELKYKYLLPDSKEECAMCLRLANDYPEYFEVITERGGYLKPHEIRLKLKEVSK